MEPEVVLKTAATLGEGPTWDPQLQRLIWVDILQCEVHAFDPSTGADAVARTPQHVGAAKPRAVGGLVLNLRDGVAVWDADAAPGGTPESTGERPVRWMAQWPEEGCRGNDAAVDSRGRLWAGSMRYDTAPGGGRLRLVDARGEVTTILADVTVSNGIGWSPDQRLMYYVDTPTRQIDVFDVDPDSGLVDRRRTLAVVDDTPGLPDGLTVDADGCIWVALWGGAAVRRYTPDGRLDRVIEFPVSQPTACAFGGPGMRNLYVTSGRDELDEARLAAEPLAGSLFVVADAGQGLPGTAFAG